MTSYDRERLQDHLRTIRRVGAVVERQFRRAGRRLLETHPAVRFILEFCWFCYERTYLAFVTLTHAYLKVHGAPIHPVTVVRVDPERIRQRTPKFEDPRFKYAGAVLDDVAEERDRPFEALTSYQGLVAHFEDGVPWQETDFYEWATARIEEGEQLWGCTTTAEFDERCRELDRLYETIATDGYKSQRELAGSDGQEPISQRRFSLVHRIVEDEIAVSIGPDGEFLFSDGRNRLTIAKLLDLESVPVCILARHADWQRLRTQVYNGASDRADLPARLRNHPDLRPLLSSRPNQTGGR